MRSQLRLVDLNQVGNVRPSRSVEVFDFGTTTPISNSIYASATAVVVLNPNTLTTNTLGETELWIDGLSAPVDVRFGGVNGVTVTSYFMPDPATLALASALPAAILTTQGDIIVGGVAGAPGRFGIGTAFQDLVVNAGATALQWANGVLARVQAAGDIVQGTGANAIARLPIGTARQNLAVNSAATALEYVASIQSLIQAAGDLIIGSAANTAIRLAVGAARLNLQVNSSADGFTYAASLQSLIVAAGDLIQGSAANTAARLAKGADGTYLGVTAGALTWIAFPAGQLPAADGAAGTPTINFTNATTAGLYRSGTGFGMTANGSAVALVTTAGLGMQSNQPIVPAAVSGTPVQNGLYQGNVEKGWVTYEGVTAGIQQSFNVSSVTDGGGSGNTIAWDRDFAATTYNVVALLQQDPAGTLASAAFPMMGNASKTAGSCIIFNVRASDGAQVDVAYVHVRAIGGQ